MLIFALGSCGSSSPSSTAAKVAANEKEDEDEDEEEPDEDELSPPTLGMTKQQVRKNYGRPFNVSLTPRGEVWTYVFNNFDGRAFIPYYGAFHEAMKQRQSCTVVFKNGSVIDFTWNQVDPMGASIWR